FVLYIYCVFRLLHSFPTRRSSDLDVICRVQLDMPPALAAALKVAESVCDLGAATKLNRNMLLVGKDAAELHARSKEDATVLDLRSEEHTSELQSRENLVCRLLLEK